MLINTTETNAEDLERLYTEARRYDLLSKTEEVEIDGAKWEAITALQQYLVEHPAGRRLLYQWCLACVEHTPDLAAFDNRQHYNLMRRELADLDTGKGSKTPLNLLRSLLQHDAKPACARSALERLSVPPGMTIALAHSLLSSPEADDPGGIAEALRSWQQQWPSGEELLPLTRSDKSQVLHLFSQYREARDKLVNHNLRLVYSIAGRYRDNGVAFIDMVQEGILGLIRAAEKFDHSKGYRFSTYAFNWIAQAIRQSLNEYSGVIRYPGHVQEQLGKLYRSRNSHWSLTGRMPADGVLADTLGISAEKTRSLLQLRNLATSADTPLLNGESDTIMMDTLSGGPFKSTSSSAENSSLEKFLLKQIAQLEPAEQQVVINRWGLQEQRSMSRAEIAEQMSVSREWVRQLEMSALKKLRLDEDVHAAYRDNGGVSAF